MRRLQAVSTSFRLSNRTAYSHWLGFNWTMTEQPDYHDRMEPLVKFSLVAPLAISLCFLGAYYLLRCIPPGRKGAIGPSNADAILTFAAKVQRKIDGATYENKRELVELLNVRVELVHEGDEDRISMACDIPGSDYAEVIRRKSTMRNFCIRVNASMLLPRRNKKFGGGILVESLFTSMVLVDSG